MLKINLSSTLIAILLSTPIVASSARDASAQNRESSSPKEVEVEAQKIFQRALAHYRGLKSYQDRVEYNYLFVSRDEDGEENRTENKKVGSLKFSKPNSINLSTEKFALVCDGHQLSLQNGTFRQYSVGPAPSPLVLDDIDMGYGINSPELGLLHPIAAVLLQRDEDVAHLFPALKKITHVEQDEETHNWRIRGKYEMIIQAVKYLTDIELTFDNSSGQLRRLRIDATRAYKQLMDDMPPNIGTEDDDMPKPPSPTKVEINAVFKNVVVNEDLPKDTFVFQPDSSDKKVDEFKRPERDLSEQQNLVGKPAPDFSGKDMEGKDIKLADLHGNVVLLDFWATWCGPCVQAIPHIQDLSEEFKDKPVVVVGINRDQKNAGKQVLKFLKKKKITFRQVMDVDGKLAEKFKVNGIPCTILIDQKGDLQKFNIGFGTRMGAQLSKNIKALLEGKTITSDENDRFVSIYSNNNEPDATDDANSSVKIEEHFPERLTKLSILQEGMDGYRFREADLDGDGHNEFISTDMSARGCLKVLSSDGTETRMIRLENSKKDSIYSFEPIRNDQTYRWLIAFAETGRMGQVSDLRLGLFDAEGKQIWTYEPKLPEKAGVQVKMAAGDLDGDSQPETVIGLDIYTMRPTGPNSYMHENQRCYLLVFSPAGKLLCCKKFNQTLALLRIITAKNPASSGCILLGDYGYITRLELSTGTKGKAKKQI